MKRNIPMRRKEIYNYICLILKYLFVMMFPVLAAALHKMTWRYIVIALAEVFLIAFLTDLLCCVKTWLGYIFNVLALLIINVQFAVLYWGNTFVSAVMLTNLDSLKAISGKFLVYGLSAVAALLFSFLPICPVSTNKKVTFSWGIGTIIVYFIIFLTGIIEYSPYRAARMLYNQMRGSSIAVNAVSDVAVNSTSESDVKLLLGEGEFYSDFVADYIAKPQDIPENPNVILIFVEGMSQNIIDDSRNITPNISALQERSLSFENYYNHTFATYMGLSGQLFSDYQLSNYDVNHLVSVQDIFKSYGYQTFFINTEPHNREFAEYLENLGFDELLTDENRVDGMVNAMSDKAAYEMLFETAIEQDEADKPFFLTMYSFGTHASLNGVHEEFGDGSNILLNRFYDLDVQAGTFLERFHESELSQNTIIIFTSDHATYRDADFATAFPGYKPDDPLMVDCMPLMIYYDGITPESYDVNGRNSLDMAPTILDYLDMSAPNYFWGDSLFAPESGSLYDTYFESNRTCYCTADGVVTFLSEEQLQAFENRLANYYTLKIPDGE